jgi:hypothetical protein
MLLPVTDLSCSLDKMTLLVLLLFFFAGSGTANPCLANTALASSNSFSLRASGLSNIFSKLGCLKDYYSFLTSCSSPLFSSSYFTLSCSLFSIDFL